MKSSRSVALLASLMLPALIVALPTAGPAMQPASVSCPVARGTPQSLAVHVHYRGTMPEQVRLEAPRRQDICLSPDPERGRFYGNYPLPSPARMMVVTVVAEYRNGEPISIPLDIGYRTEPLAFTLPRPTNGPCLDRLVRRISRNLGSRDAALSATYQARHWYHARSGCPTSQKADVALAWFDRSYEAASLEPAFRLDLAAGHALSELPSDDARRRNANRRHVQDILNRYALQGARKIYTFARELGEGGFALDAIQMSDSIAEAIRADPETALLYRRVGINLDRLSDDRRFYINKSGISPSKLGVIRRRPTPEVARIPTLAVGELKRGVGQEGPIS